MSEWCFEAAELGDAFGKCGIYIIWHTVYGLAYVGQAIDIGKRIKQHSAGSGRGALAQSIKNAGWASFRWSIIEECARGQLVEREQYWIDELGTRIPCGYNNEGMDPQFYITQCDVRKMR